MDENQQPQHRDDVRHFHVHSCLGQGGFGEVYKATMTSAGGVRHEVAIKVLHEGLDPRSQAVQRLREEYYAAGTGELYEALKDFQPGQSRASQSYAELALRLAKSESAIASAIHRFRRRHAELLRAEVAQTVASRDEVNDEIRYLVEVLSR